MTCGFCDLSPDLIQSGSFPKYLKPRQGWPSVRTEMKGWVNLGALLGQNPAESRSSLEWGGAVEQHPIAAGTKCIGDGVCSPALLLCVSVWRQKLNPRRSDHTSPISHLPHQKCEPIFWFPFQTMNTSQYIHSFLHDE